jgi:hypothetical protein
MDLLWDSDGDGGGGGGGEILSSSDDEAARGAGASARDDDDDDAAPRRGDGADMAPELLLVEENVAPAEVLARIEAAAASLLRGLAETPPRVPPLELASRRVVAAVTRKRLFSSRDGGAAVRVWRVLAECHANLTAGRSATQRELYCASSATPCAVAARARGLRCRCACAQPRSGC